MKYLLRALAKLMRLLTFGRFKYSRPVEGNAAYMGLGEKLWYGYKFYGNPIREPERGKNIREYFQEHSPEGFRNENAARYKVEDLPSITIALAGDILPCPGFPKIPSGHLCDVINFFKTADIRCANLESPVVSWRPVNIPPEDILAPPDMNNSPEAIKFLLQNTGDAAGITIFSTANNHAMDQGVEGVAATLDFLDELGVLHVGTARSSTERDKLLMIGIRGYQIAFLSWTFSLNCHRLPDDREYLVNTMRLNLPGIDISPIAAQVREARIRGAEAVVLFLHWGLEDECFPLASQIETAHRLAECGVDIICGNHPHALQPAERYVWKDQNSGEDLLRESLIIYALGDFLTPQPYLGMSALSAIMEVTLVRRDDGRILIYDVKTKHLDAS